MEKDKHIEIIRDGDHFYYFIVINGKKERFTAKKWGDAVKHIKNTAPQLKNITIKL